MAWGVVVSSADGRMNTRFFTPNLKISTPERRPVLHGKLTLPFGFGYLVPNIQWIGESTLIQILCLRHL
jgi:hypothetical protein